MSELERHQFFTRLVAWGDPTSARLAMIGWEDGGSSWVHPPCPAAKRIVDRCEGGPEDADAEIEARMKDRICLSGGHFCAKWSPRLEDTPCATERVQCYLAARLRQRLLNNTVTTEDYYQQKFLRGFEVAGNLFPFAKQGKSLDLPVEMKQYLGIGRLNRFEQDTILAIRLNGLTCLANYMKGRGAVIVFMGVSTIAEKTYEDNILKQLHPRGIPPIDDKLTRAGYCGRKAKRLCRIYHGDPVLCFVHHPAHGLFNEDVADALVSELGRLLAKTHNTCFESECFKSEVHNG